VIVADIFDQLGLYK